VRMDPSRWTEYRVHSSASHTTISDPSAESEVREFRKALGTGEVLGGAVATVRGRKDAVRLSTSWQMETRTIVFLMDPRARLSLGDWFRLGVSALRRRQVYIASMWAYCPYRWMAPERASRAYRARRRGELRRTAGADRGPPPDRSPS
jgi:hypothetical protein